MEQSIWHDELRLRHAKIRAELAKTLAADGRLAEGRVAGGKSAEGRDRDNGGKPADGRLADGRLAEGHVAGVRPAEGRLSEGRPAAGAFAPEECAMLVACMANAIYTTGRACDAFVYLPLAGEPRLFVRKPFGLGPDDVGGMRLAYVTKPEQIPGLLAEAGAPAPRALFIEDMQISHAEATRISRAFQGAELLPGGSQLMLRARAVKTEFETGRIRETCEKLSEVFSRIPELFKPGMTDAELGRTIEFELCRAGHLGIIRSFGRSIEVPSGGALLAGGNAIVQGAYDYALSGGGRDRTMPAGADGSRIAEGQTVMVDFGCNTNGYIGDMTRTFAFGEPPAQAREALAAAIEIQDLVARAAKPGAKCSDLYGIAARHAESRGLGRHFMGFGQQSKFIGHGVGLELNELPVIAPKIDMRLEEGMAISLEPKFALPGIGAVGVENTYVVAPDGLTRLTQGDDGLALMPR